MSILFETAAKSSDKLNYKGDGRTIGSVPPIPMFAYTRSTSCRSIGSSCGR